MAKQPKKQSSGKGASRFVGTGDDIRILKPASKKNKKK